VVNLRGHLNGRPLDLPSWTYLFVTATLPSVAGGPADPATWDRWFGEMNAFAAGEGEVKAQQAKAEALPAAVADLYRQVRELRAAGAPAADCLAALQAEASRFPQEWLLKAELEELLGAPASV